MFETVYHVNDGPVQMYAVDANTACNSFPNEWSRIPWRDRPQKVETTDVPTAAPVEAPAEDAAPSRKK